MTKVRPSRARGGQIISLRNRTSRCCLLVLLALLVVPSDVSATEEQRTLLRATLQSQELCNIYAFEERKYPCWLPFEGGWTSSPPFLLRRDRSAKAITPNSIPKLIDDLSVSKQVEIRFFISVVLLVVSAVLLVVTPFFLVGRTRWQVGVSPVGWPKKLQDIENSRRCLKEINERLCSWMQDNKETPRSVPGLDPVLDKLCLVLDRLQWLRTDLRRVLGFGFSLTGLYAELSGRVAELGEQECPPTLLVLFDELRQLRRLRDELCKHEPRISEEGLSAWIDRLTVWFSQNRKISEEISKLGTSPSAVLGHLQLLCAEAQRFEPKWATTLGELPSLFEGARVEFWKLGKIAGIDLTLSVRDQIEVLCGKWGEKSQELEKLRRHIEEKEAERQRLHGIAQRIAGTFATPQPAIDQQLVDGVSTVMSERRTALQHLQPWVSAPNLRLDEMASELSLRLARLEQNFFPKQVGQDHLTWYQRLEQRLGEAIVLEDKLRVTEDAQTVSCTYLGLGELPVPWAVLSREINQPHRALRLALLAALDRASSIGKHPADYKLFELLHLGEILDRVPRFIAGLASWPGPDELWKQGIVPAFGSQWLHDLLRAELILDTYYVRTETNHRLGPVRALAEAFREATHAVGRPVLPVGLLAMPEPTWKRLRKVSGLIQLPEVRQQVRERSQRGGGFVVDVERFALPGQEWLEECQVILFNPADWDPSQERQA